MLTSRGHEAATSRKAHPQTVSALPPRQEARPRALRALKTLSQWHRWLGVATCLLFALWFSTGTVMLFVPFPDLPIGERARAMPPVDVSRVLVPPGVAAANLPALRRLQLVQGLRGPSYILLLTSGPARSIDAVTGRPTALLSADGARATARRFCRCDVAAVAGPYDYDQWIVHQRFDPERPFYRVDLADPRATSLYISQRTGEVLQRTDRRQRIFNYCGSVIHWIYPTILRRYPNGWSWTVWGVSLVAIMTGAAGFTLGLIRSRNALRNARKRSVTPFKGLLRWHHLLGLSAGSILLTWITSGWLSVDHGLLFPTGNPSPREIAAFQGRTLAEAANLIELPAVRHLDGFAIMNFSVVGGTPFLSGWKTTSGREQTLTTAGSAISAVPSRDIVAAVAAAWPGAHPHLATISPTDAYGHLLYDGIPETSVRVKLEDAAGTWVHVDAGTGEIVEVVDWRRRIYRWLFNGLHTFDIPGLEQHDLIRKLIMLPCLAAGFALSVSGVVLGLRRIRMSL